MVQIDVVKIFYHGVIFHKKWSYKWDGLIKTGLQEGWFFSVQNGLMGGGGLSLKMALQERWSLINNGLARLVVSH